MILTKRRPLLSELKQGTASPAGSQATPGSVLKRTLHSSVMQLEAPTFAENTRAAAPTSTPVTPQQIGRGSSRILGWPSGRATLEPFPNAEVNKARSSSQHTLQLSALDSEDTASRGGNTPRSPTSQEGVHVSARARCLSGLKQAAAARRATRLATSTTFAGITALSFSSSPEPLRSTHEVSRKSTRARLDACRQESMHSAEALKRSMRTSVGTDAGPVTSASTSTCSGASGRACMKSQPPIAHPVLPLPVVPMPGRTAPGKHLHSSGGIQVQHSSMHGSSVVMDRPRGLRAPLPRVKLGSPHAGPALLQMLCPPRAPAAPQTAHYTSSRSATPSERCTAPAIAEAVPWDEMSLLHAVRLAAAVCHRLELTRGEVVLVQPQLSRAAANAVTAMPSISPPCPPHISTSMSAGGNNCTGQANMMHSPEQQAAQVLRVAPTGSRQVGNNILPFSHAGLNAGTRPLSQRGVTTSSSGSSSMTTGRVAHAGLQQHASAPARPGDFDAWEHQVRALMHVAEAEAGGVMHEGARRTRQATAAGDSSRSGSVRGGGGSASGGSVGGAGSRGVCTMLLQPQRRVAACSSVHPLMPLQQPLPYAAGSSSCSSSSLAGSTSAGVPQIPGNVTAAAWVGDRAQPGYPNVDQGEQELATPRLVMRASAPAAAYLGSARAALAQGRVCRGPLLVDRHVRAGRLAEALSARLLTDRMAVMRCVGPRPVATAMRAAAAVLWRKKLSTQYYVACVVQTERYIVPMQTLCAPEQDRMSADLAQSGSGAAGDVAGRWQQHVPHVREHAGEAHGSRGMLEGHGPVRMRHVYSHHMHAAGRSSHAANAGSSRVLLNRQHAGPRYHERPGMVMRMPSPPARSAHPGTIHTAMRPAAAGSKWAEMQRAIRANKQRRRRHRRSLQRLQAHALRTQPQHAHARHGPHDAVQYAEDGQPQAQRVVEVVSIWLLALPHGSLALSSRGFGVGAEGAARAAPTLRCVHPFQV